MKRLESLSLVLAKATLPQVYTGGVGISSVENFNPQPILHHTQNQSFEHSSNLRVQI